MRLEKNLYIMLVSDGDKLSLPRTDLNIKYPEVSVNRIPKRIGTLLCRRKTEIPSKNNIILNMNVKRVWGIIQLIKNCSITRDITRNEIGEIGPVSIIVHHNIIYTLLNTNFGIPTQFLYLANTCD